MGDYLIDKALHDGQSGDDGSMDREDDVIQLHWIVAAGESLKVFVLDVRDPVEGRVEHCVKCVSEKIQREKIEIQADDGLALVVVPDLRVKRDRPGGEVDPADNDRDENDGRRVRDANPDEQAGVIDICVWSGVSEHLDLSGALASHIDDLHEIVAVSRHCEADGSDHDQVIVVLVEIYQRGCSQRAPVTKNQFNRNPIDKFKFLTQFRTSSSSTRRQLLSTHSLTDATLSFYWCFVS